MGGVEKEFGRVGNGMGCPRTMVACAVREGERAQLSGAGQI